jgi:hypothetical protein
MDDKSLNLVLRSKSIPEINKITGNYYDIYNDINIVKKEILEKHCEENKLLILDKDEDVIKSIFLEYKLNDKQSKLIKLLSEFNIIAIPIEENKKENKSKEWIAVDLDGTIATYNDTLPHDPETIGDPIPKMISRIKKWINDGKQIKIMTARADKNDKSAEVIKKWCIKHIGQELEITNTKDKNMTELWDDRAIQIVKNTGDRVDGKD